MARNAAWHVLHPSSRQPCVEAPAPPPLQRLFYVSSDGWRAPLRLMPAVPGGSGEPVVLAHAVGVSANAFRYGAGPTLASRLSRAGFSVYLLAHRGDVGATPPVAGRLGFDFDDILERDVPAALARVREHSGFPAVHWVGHGLGGQLGMAWAARTDSLASVVSVCAPATFPGGALRSEARGLTRAASLLPSGWAIPARLLAAASVPWIDPTSEVLGQVAAGASSRSRLRGVLAHATEDLPIGLLRQIDRWASDGSWTDRSGRLDHAEALADAVAPLLVVVAKGDTLCPPAAGLYALERWGGLDRDHIVLGDEWGHLDPIVAPDADDHVVGPIVDWLRDRRRAAWERDPLG